MTLFYVMRTGTLCPTSLWGQLQASVLMGVGLVPTRSWRSGVVIQGTIPAGDYSHIQFFAESSYQLCLEQSLDLEAGMGFQDTLNQ